MYSNVYFRAIDNVTAENGTVYTKGMIINEISYKGLPKGHDAYFEPDKETTSEENTERPEKELPYKNDRFVPQKKPWEL